jgi:hypothetical protein
MNFCSLQDAYGIKTFKSPKVVKMGQKGKGLRGVYDTPSGPPTSATIGAPAGGCEDQEDVLITKARQTSPIVIEHSPMQAPAPDPIVVQPIFNVDIDRMDLGLVVFSIGVMLMIILGKK